MSDELHVGTLSQAAELVAAGSWAIDSALRCLEAGDHDKARSVLERGQETVRRGLSGLSGVLDEMVRDSYERPERLARALESLQELQGLQPTRDA